MILKRPGCSGASTDFVLHDPDCPAHTVYLVDLREPWVVRVREKLADDCDACASMRLATGSATIRCPEHREPPE